MWAQQLARGKLGQINAEFGANGAVAQRVLWQPTSSHIQTPHRAAILKKLGINSIAELVRYAVRNKVIEA